MMRPAAAPAAMSTGSGTLKRHAMPKRHGRDQQRGHVDDGAPGEHEAGAGDGAGGRRRHPADERLDLGLPLNRSNHGNGMTTNR